MIEFLVSQPALHCPWLMINFNLWCGYNPPRRNETLQLRPLQLNHLNVVINRNGVQAYEGI